MGFLKRLFGNKTTAAVQAGTQEKRTVTENSVQTKTEEDEYYEKVLRWGRINDLPDVRERIRKMEELAYSGFDTAYLSLSDYYMELAEINNEVEWDKVNYWLEKACEADLPNGHFYMALTRRNPKNPHHDIDRAIEEFCIAAGQGVEGAVQEIVRYGTPDDESDPESVRIAESNKAVFAEEMEPVVDELLKKEDAKSWDALGLLHFYGVCVEQDFDKAKEYFMKAGNERMLKNPVFADEDDEDED